MAAKSSIQNHALKLVVALVLVVGVITAARLVDLQSLLRHALKWISDFGTWAALMFALLYIVATVLLVPGSILTFGAGVLFGVVWGSLLVSLAATLGAGTAFLISRYFARERIGRRIEGRPKFKAIDEAVGREGWKIVLLTRLSPIFPFNFLNYAYGLTRVAFWQYLWASWLGMLPGTVLYVYVGSLAGDLAGLGRARERSPVEWAFYGVGLLATIAVTVYVTRLAKSALKKRIEPG